MKKNIVDFRKGAKRYVSDESIATVTGAVTAAIAKLEEHTGMRLNGDMSRIKVAIYDGSPYVVLDRVRVVLPIEVSLPKAA